MREGGYNAGRRAVRPHHRSAPEHDRRRTHDRGDAVRESSRAANVAARSRCSEVVIGAASSGQRANARKDVLAGAGDATRDRRGHEASRRLRAALHPTVRHGAAYPRDGRRRRPVCRSSEWLLESPAVIENGARLCKEAVQAGKPQHPRGVQMPKEPWARLTVLRLHKITESGPRSA